MAEQEIERKLDRELLGLLPTSLTKIVDECSLSNDFLVSLPEVSYEVWYGPITGWGPAIVYQPPGWEKAVRVIMSDSVPTHKRRAILMHEFAEGYLRFIRGVSPESAHRVAQKAEKQYESIRPRYCGTVSRLF